MESGYESLGLLLHDAQRAMRRAFDRRMGEHGLSSAQWRLLLHAMRETEPTQTRLADRMEIEPISVSRLIDRMEALGWVTRQPAPQDRRVRLVIPTPRASALRDDLRGIAQEIFAEALRGVTEQQKDGLTAGLRAVIRNLAEAELAATAGQETANDD